MSNQQSISILGYKEIENAIEALILYYEKERMNELNTRIIKKMTRKTIGIFFKKRPCKTREEAIQEMKDISCFDGNNLFDNIMSTGNNQINAAKALLKMASKSPDKCITITRQDFQMLYAGKTN